MKESDYALLLGEHFGLSFRWLRDAGVGVNTTSAKGIMALDPAADLGKEDLVERLLA